MVPGNAVIVKQDASAASGASISDYKLGGCANWAYVLVGRFACTNLQLRAQNMFCYVRKDKHAIVKEQRPMTPCSRSC